MRKKRRKEEMPVWMKCQWSGGRSREAARRGEWVFECAGKEARREQGGLVP